MSTDGEFKLVSTKGRKLTKTERDKKQAWKRFCQHIFPSISDKYVSDEVKSYLEQHPDANKKDAEAWARRHWKQLVTDVKYEEEFEMTVAAIEPRAAKNAWKRYDLNDFKIDEEYSDNKKAKSKAVKKTPATSDLDDVVVLNGGTFGVLGDDE